MARPNDKNVKWCVENADFIATLLEKRGGWQGNDWYYDSLREQVRLTPSLTRPMVRSLGRHVIWLPTEGDALEMLIERGVLPILSSALCVGEGQTWVSWEATYDGAPKQSLPTLYDTPLIALLELLQRV